MVKAPAGPQHPRLDQSGMGFSLLPYSTGAFSFLGTLKKHAHDQNTRHFEKTNNEMMAKNGSSVGMA